MLKNKEEIESWLKQYDIENYIINEDLTVSVDGNINLYRQKLQTIPIKFNMVNGFFNCSQNNLTSLEFCPQKINGTFNCSDNNITSLVFCPQEINGDFDCSHNKLTSLKYCPEKIKNCFFCDDNLLESLQFLPTKIPGYLDISYNKIKIELIYLFNSHVEGNIYNDFGTTEKFLNLVQEQKILKEKEDLKNKLYSTENSQLAKKRL